MKSLDSVWQDIMFGTRLLRKAPMFAVAVILTFALGVGANTAVFSVVNAIMLRPLPVRDGDRLVVIASHDTASRSLRGLSYPELQDYRAASRDVFEDIVGYSIGFLGLAVQGSRPDRVLVTWVTGNYFQLLDLRPPYGRLIRNEEGGSGRADAVVVLGYTAWQRRFGGDPSVLGTIVRVNGHPCTIVGVAPPGFAGTFAFSESELYLPLNWSVPDDLDDRRARGLHTIARLHADATVENAQAAMDVVAARLAQQHPESNENVAVRVLPERFARPEEDQYRTNALGAALTLAMVGIVMMVATANVTNLLLSRATGRRQELAIRAALGARRGRLVRQMMTESLLLAILGGGVGILVGTWAARAFATIRLPGDLPVRFDFDLDARVLIYASTMAVVAGLVVGLLAAVRASRVDLDRTLRQSRHVRSQLVSRFLVVAQIATCLVLLVVAGLFVRSLRAAERADLGFQPNGVLNIHMDVGQLGYTETQGRAFFEELDRRVRSIPGVEHVSFAFTIPMGYIRVSVDIEAEGRAVEDRERLSAGKNIVSPEYFDTMGIPMIRGRTFAEADNGRSRPVAIVNQQLADQL